MYVIIRFQRQLHFSIFIFWRLCFSGKSAAQMGCEDKLQDVASFPGSLPSFFWHVVRKKAEKLGREPGNEAIDSLLHSLSENSNGTHPRS